jgi:hypothetical protein
VESEESTFACAERGLQRLVNNVAKAQPEAKRIGNYDKRPLGKRR